MRLDAGRPPHVFVVPAYDEERNLPRLLRDLEARPELFPPGSRAIVVDDGSRDATPAIVRGYRGALPLELLRLERNQGPGAAFRHGFTAALAGCPADALVVTLEADTTSDLDSLPEMLARAEAGADLVVARWVMVRVSPLRRLLSEGSGLLVRTALGVPVHTVSSFLRVYRAEALRRAVAHYGDALITEPGFACKAEVLVKMSALGARVEEVAVELDSTRRIGASKMPILRTTLTYGRMCARQLRARRTLAA